MPVVRSYGARKIGLAPLPGVRRTAAATPTSEGAGLEVARAQTGETLSQVAGLGAQIGARAARDVWDRERQQAAQTRLLAANRRFDDLELSLHDPQHGAFAAAKGEASLGLLDAVTTRFDTEAAEIGRGLTAREQPAFAQLKEQRRQRIRDSVVSYTDREMQAYEQRERTAALSSAQQIVATNADDVHRVAEQIALQRTIIATWPGLGPQARADATAAAVSTTHRVVLDNYLARGLDRKAQAYYEEVRDQIRVEDRTVLEGKLESASTDGAGLRASEAIWQQHGPQADEDAIALDTMEDAARAQFSADPKTLKATIAFLRERKQGVDAGRKERADAAAGDVWRAVNAGATLAQVKTLPAYRALPSKLQLAVTEHVVQAAEARADRSYMLTERTVTAARRAEAEKEQGGWAMLWHYDHPAILSQMSENQILALTADLGVQHVNRLIEKKREYATPAKLVEATLDADLFKALADEAGLRPYASETGPGAEARRAILGQTENAVKAAIAAEQGSKGRTLSRGEKMDITRTILDRRVLLDRWGQPSLPTAAVVNATDRAAAYVPLDQIPPPSLNQWVNVIRSQFPREQTATRAEILARWRDRIQRAHAASLLGLGVEEETRRLQGR